MNPLLDQLAVAAIVVGALAYFARQIFRRRAAGKSCGSGCCTPKAQEFPQKSSVSEVRRS